MSTKTVTTELSTLTELQPAKPAQLSLPDKDIPESIISVPILEHSGTGLTGCSLSPQAF
jgi:hypothetical protein